MFVGLCVCVCVCGFFCDVIFGFNLYKYMYTVTYTHSSDIAPHSSDIAYNYCVCLVSHTSNKPSIILHLCLSYICPGFGTQLSEATVGGSDGSKPHFFLEMTDFLVFSMSFSLARTSYLNKSTIWHLTSLMEIALS